MKSIYHLPLVTIVLESVFVFTATATAAGMILPDPLFEALGAFVWIFISGAT